MDTERFDRIAKTLSTSHSRRRMLGGLLGSALGGLLARFRPKAAGATHTGCRHTGAVCTKPGQCCTGRCAANGTCQPCTSAAQCPAPLASEPCQKRICTTAGRCVIRPKDEGVACPDDGNPCTKNLCDGSGTCSHPPKTGAACTSDDQECTDDVCDASGACSHPNKANHTTCSTGTCQDGACEACLALKANCATAEECCQDDGATECAGIGDFFIHQCCRPLGGACSTPDLDECCMALTESGGIATVSCASNNTCGGPGARCDRGAGCVSGQCCVDHLENGTCC